MHSDSWNPKQYEKFKDERSLPFYDLMSLVLPHDHAEIVDLGCGTAQLTSILQQKMNAKRTIGIDSSDQMLSAAAQFKNEKLFFRKDTIENFKEQKAFDIIFSNSALQWCSDHPILLKNFCRALKPGGQLAIQMPLNQDYPTHILAAQMRAEQPWAGYLKNDSFNIIDSILKPEDYARLLFGLGFSEQKVFVRVYAHKLEDRFALIEWVTGTMLTFFESRLPEDIFKNFLAEYRQRLFEMIPDEKPFFYPFKRLFIWGRGP